MAGFFDAGEFRASIGGCRITSTSAAPISVIVRNSSGFDRLLLRTIAEMGSALVDAIRYVPILPCNSPDTEKRRKSEPRWYMAAARHVEVIS